MTLREAVKPFVARVTLGSCLLAATCLGPSCSGSGPASSGQIGGAKPAGGQPAAAGGGPVVMGERFGPRPVPDPQQDGLVVGVVSVPEKWRFSSKVVWNYAYISNPVAISTSFENPANEEAVFGYPTAAFYDLHPVLVPGMYRLGENSVGLVLGHPMPPLDTLASFIRQARAGAPNLQLVGSKDLPDLPAAFNMPPAPNQTGVGIKVTYDLNGKPVEEEFYGISYFLDIPYDGPQGRTYETHWGLSSLHSFRAPAGTLDRRRPIFSAIAKSFRPNPAWQQRYGAINKYLQAEFDRQLKLGYERIAAAGALSRQISANNDAMIASIDRQLQTSRTPSASGTTEGRSASDKFDDYIRGVETTDDPYYGTSQHSINQQFHWTDGYGNYRNSNDTTYDPNRTEVGNWQLMKSIR